MCLGLVGRIVELVDNHPDLALVEIAGVCRPINVGLLDGPEPGGPRPGTFVLVHMGFALQTLTDEEAAEALSTLDSYSAERYGEGDGYGEGYGSDGGIPEEAPLEVELR